MTVGSLCNLNLQQFTSATFRGTVVRERERERYGCYGCRSHKDIYRGSSIDEDRGRGGEEKKKEGLLFGPGLTGIISDTVLSVEAVWARGPTERRAAATCGRLSLTLECIVAGCYVKYGRGEK